jgi:hypothetical protein
MDRKAAGIGYTVLAWSRDGRTWQRDHEMFLANAKHPDAWDHANAWGTSQLVIGDETYVYYAGYKRGHKVARYDERQIGLAIMGRDRYVAREADINTGRLITKPVTMDASALTVNARVEGMLKVRIVDIKGNPISGFDWIALEGDSVAHPAEWPGELKNLRNKRVRIEFKLKDTQLFGFDLIP